MFCFDDIVIQKGFDTMKEELSSAVFGLNFLQEMKGDNSVDITGAYDPEQELWVSQGQPLASLGTVGSVIQVTGGVHYSITNHIGGYQTLDKSETPTDRNYTVRHD